MGRPLSSSVLISVKYTYLNMYTLIWLGKRNTIHSAAYTQYIQGLCQLKLS